MSRVGYIVCGVGERPVATRCRKHRVDDARVGVRRRRWHVHQPIDADATIRPHRHRRMSRSFERGVEVPSKVACVGRFGPCTDTDDIVEIESLEQAKATVEKFSASDSKLKVQPLTAPEAQDCFPLSVEVARLRLKVLREGGSYKVTTDTSDRLTKKVVEAVVTASRSIGKKELF